MNTIGMNAYLFSEVSHLARAAVSLLAVLCEEAKEELREV